MTPTTVTLFSSVDNNTTSWADSVSSPVSTHGDLSTLLVTSTFGVTGSQDVTSEGSLFFSSTASWSTSASVTMAATQVNKTIPSVVVGEVRVDFFSFVPDWFNPSSISFDLKLLILNFN